MFVNDEVDHPTDGHFSRVLSGAQERDEWAFAELFREWNPVLLRFLGARAPDVAEDLASDVWAGVARQLGSFEGGRSEWRSWLFTMAHGCLVDHVRRRSRRRTDPSPPVDFLNEAAVDDPAAEVTDRMSTQGAIDSLIGSLTAEQAEVVLLRVVAGLDAAEVAQIMGHSTGWVRVTQHRALRRLPA
jgi:RNA polymerase sigma-70 factor, ECF subfamily